MDAPACLRALTAPRRVALVGASSDDARVTARPQRFLELHRFAGDVCPVNPRRDRVLGVRAAPSVEAIGAPVDHACILVGTEQVEDALADCTRAGVKVVSVLADGFADSGDAGRARERRLVEQAEAAGMLLLGPNSMGVVDTRSGFVCTTNAAFAADSLPGGRVAVLSQSGSIIGALASRGAACGVGFSTLVSVGNEAHAGVGRIGELLLVDDGTDAFVVFLETLRDWESFAAFARGALDAGKPVFAYVVGASAAGRELAVSHTGAMLGSGEALDAFLDAHGVRRVQCFEALLEAPAAALAVARAKRSVRRVTALTTTGGGGAMVVDRLAARGVEVGGCPASAAPALAAAGIHVGSGPLVDVTLAGANAATMRAAIEAIACAPQTGAVLVAIGSSAQFEPERAVQPLIDFQRQAPAGAAPIFACPLPDAPQALARLRGSGIPCFRSIESCVDSVALALLPSRGSPVVATERTRVFDAALATAPAGLASEHEAAALLRLAGVEVVPSVVLALDESLPAQLPFAAPYVAKRLVAGVAHKSDSGAVLLHLEDRAALETALTRLRQLDGAHEDVLLVQPCIEGIGEVIVGCTRDARVGPIVSVGVGGVLAELHTTRSVRPAPVDREQAQAMLDAVPLLRALSGYRGGPAGDVAALSSAIVALSQLATHPRVTEVEVNPLVVTTNGAIAVDALLNLDDPATR